MDIGFEGDFKILKSTLNVNMCSDWIKNEDDKYYTLNDTIFETVFANDIVSQAKISWCDYFGNKKQKNVSDIYHLRSIVDIVKDYKLGNSNVFPSDVEIVIGGFPCQDFSISGKRNGFNSHMDHAGKCIIYDIPTEESRGKLYMWMKEVIEITLPKIFIAENVKGLANMGDVKDIIQSDFSNIGNEEYIVLNPRILNAGMYGIPQSRERIFFIGFKKSSLKKDAIRELTSKFITDKYSPYPKSTHRLPNENSSLFDDSLIAPFVSCKNVLLDLLEPAEALDISQRYYSQAKFMGKHCQGQIEIDMNSLSPTIRSEHHGNIEFRRLSKENGGRYINELNRGMIERRLTLRECARIQTFPDDYNFVIENHNSRTRYLLSPSVGYKLVGNAVPPLLAYHIAKKIEDNWDLYFV